MTLKREGGRGLLVRGGREACSAFLRAYVAAGDDEAITVSYGTADGGVPTIALSCGAVHFGMRVELAAEFVQVMELLALANAAGHGAAWADLAEHVGHVVRLVDVSRPADVTVQ